MTITTTDPTVIVSVDTHIGPRLAEDLRAYCPADELDAFDAFAAASKEFRGNVLGIAAFLAKHPNFTTEGHHDPAARLKDYDFDGVAAGLIFHGSQNFEPMPFGPIMPGQNTKDRTQEAVGYQIYNRWLADFVSTSPHRHIGVAYLPMWDIDASITELQWAQQHGLKAVNFPALVAGNSIREYNDPAWDPFWAACQELDMRIITHVGAADRVNYGLVEGVAIRAIETGSFFSQRSIWWLIFSGVFERFPALKYMIAETPGSWLPNLTRELDAIWNMFSTEKAMNAAFYDKVPRPPRDYLRENVFLGASFTSPFEAEQAVVHDYVDRLMWGSDYPHIEGTYVNPTAAAESVTKLALRNTFNKVDEEETARMLGDNAIDFFGLDRVELQRIAGSIGAPSLDDLRQPIDAIPELGSMHAFRTGTTAWS